MDTQPLNVESRSTRSLARICEEPFRIFIHLLAAAICWLAASLIWIIKVMPKVTISEPE